jgi:DGQHR domain-containing protein
MKKGTKSKTKTKKSKDAGQPAKLPGPFKYESFVFDQRPKHSPTLAIFHAPVRQVLSWADIDALSYKNVGPQRERKKARVTQIKRFLATENVIPTAIIVGFNKGMTEFTPTAGSIAGCGTLEITLDGDDSFAATVVDGQHRLYGIDEYSHDAKVPIVGLLDADELEKAFQFLVINNKASKVPPAHAKALLAKMNEKALADRLRTARVSLDVAGARDVDLVNSDDESPFFESIDWPATKKENRLVQPTAIELSLEYIKNLGVSEFDDRDVRRSLFLAIWKVIKAKWPSLWKRNSRLLSKVGIYCLTRFVIDMITNWADNDELNIELTELDEIKKHTNKILRYMDPGFWTTPWAASAQGGFDTNQGRQRVVDALTQMYRNVRREEDWSTDIDILEKPGTN